MSTAHTIVESPLGELILVAENGRLSGVYFPGHWTRPDPATFGERTQRRLEQVEEQLAEYFARERTRFELPASVAIAEACASGELSLDPHTDRQREHAALLALPGIGPWTADYIRMRAMGDRDVLLATDLGVRRSADALGVDLTGGRPEWAPCRSYATHHLWAAAHY